LLFRWYEEPQSWLELVPVKLRKQREEKLVFERSKGKRYVTTRNILGKTKTTPRSIKDPAAT
jgi:hypothetical protein